MEVETYDLDLDFMNDSEDDKKLVTNDTDFDHRDFREFDVKRDQALYKLRAMELREGMKESQQQMEKLKNLTAADVTSFIVFLFS